MNLFKLILPMNPSTTVLCPICGKGHLIPKVIDYTVSLPDGLKIIVPKVSVEICEQCGEIALSTAAGRQIDAYIAEQNEQLSPRELERIREDLGVDQTQMSEALGLGTKTYHRWEKGNQIPSRSMGYYLRVLAEFTEAFEWLRERRWREKNRLAVISTLRASVDFDTSFPDLRGSGNSPSRLSRPRFNPARALLGGTR
jgi:putative zinc finger/helix-turn-helix YgiT family protein